MTRWPVVPTILVAAAVAAMIALGLWQLNVRLPEKEAQLAQLAGNPARAVVAFPATPDDRYLFRRATGTCTKAERITRAGAGAAGFRLIAECRTPVRGQVMHVQLGTTRRADLMTVWPGGPVSGWITHAPDARPLIAGLFDRSPRELMLVADRPLAGLQPNLRPDVATVPNNHLAYAVQWFFFAAIAGIVYVLAVRYRARTR